MPLNTNVTGRLDAFFNLKNFADVVTSLPKPQAQLTNLLFPESKRKQKASPFIAKSEIKNETGAVPIVRKDSQAYPVNDGETDTDIFNPQAIKMSKFVLGSELNTLIAMGAVENINAKLTEVIQFLRDKTSTTLELLVAQSLSGKISYPEYVLGGGTSNYEVNLGTLKSVTASTLTASSKTGDLLKALEAQFIAQQQTGASADVHFLAGSEAYAMIVNIVTDVNNNVPVQWTDTGCTLFGKYKIMPISSTYALPGKKTVTEVVDPKSLQTVDLQNTGTLFYAALDDLDAKLQPLPFFATYEHKKDPSGIKVISESKPLPAFAVNKSTIKKYVS